MHRSATESRRLMAECSTAQDPNERFDVVRADGTPTGITKRRADVHRDGDWHRAIHVWVTGVADGGEPFLLFQRRSLHKDTWPGRLDATVGGHYRAGETLAETLRETEEEIGVTADLSRLRPLGVRVCANEAEPGIIDHELQDVFLLRDDRPLTGYRPHPAELAALVRVDLNDLLALLGGEARTADADVFAPGDREIRRSSIGLDDFIPTIDRYFYRVAIAVAVAHRGDRHLAV
jgi:isopentenyldiphosphate isomerase